MNNEFTFLDQFSQENGQQSQFSSENPQPGLECAGYSPFTTGQLSKESTSQRSEESDFFRVDSWVGLGLRSVSFRLGGNPFPKENREKSWNKM